MSSPLTSTAPRWLLATVVLAVAVLVAVPVAAASGATTPLVLGDAGAVVRWGQPLVRILHDLAASLTLGLLLVGGLLARESTDGKGFRRTTAAQGAFAGGVVWMLSVLVMLYLTYAELAGTPPSAPGFLEDLIGNVWALEVLRLLLVEAVIVAALVALCAYASSRATLTWALAVGLSALLPLAFTGHASSTLGHETAVNALALHLVGITLWVGGLLAIAVLLPVLGPALPDTVARFSTLAAWCFGAVAVSGILFATVSVGTPANLFTPYGAVVVAKVTLLLVLGGAGWLQRRRVVARGVDSPPRFARLALGELVLMGAAVGLGVVLGRTPTPEPVAVDVTPVISLTMHPMPEPWSWARMFTTWRPDWLFVLAAVVAVGLYAAAVVRLRRRGDRWPLHKLLLWTLGWAAFVYVTSGGPGVYGRVMFSVHMVSHMALMMGVPILLVPANAITLAMRALPSRRDGTLGPRELLLSAVHSRWASFVVNPVVAGMLFFGSLVGFYWSGILGWALSTHAGHVFMIVHFTLVGYAFVWALVGTDPGPAKWPAPLRMIVLLVTLASHAFFGLSIFQGGWLLAPEFFKTIDVPWVQDLLADQQLGGGIAWGLGELPTLLLMLMVAVDWMRRDERDAARSDRQAERDHDAELTAYNARLAQLAKQDRTAGRTR
ncbi:cytochrome c oxidase assembly protein [Ornithinimicrobium avium]|uniref:Cytochrome C oxidase assembly protein n=1 Tax=Ornithinimicrobium avium TaxID=2283195 RepID=A0A345NMR8_9MICO|nr:cytochrome c oxidase assembly protein [Ornithinimicrobium avium]AXH96326.1 cytochrome C oxidase assembly protein [Ornithinimicrobium avium]